MNIAICGHGGQGMTESIRAMLESGQLRVVDIEAVTQDIQDGLEQKIRKLAEDLEDMFNGHSAEMFACAAPLIESKPMMIPEEYHAVMAYYSHIRDKPEKVGVITCLA